MNVKEALKVFRKGREQIMSSPICHLVMTPFTGFGNPGFRGDEWYKERIEIFKNNTLKSLENQSNQFFVHWITFRPEEQKNSLTKGLFSYLCGVKWRTIFTFGGLCFWDDNFDRTEKRDLKKRLKNTLPALREIVGDAKYVYETLLASDDMLHVDVIESIQQRPFVNKGAIVHVNGLIRNLKDNRLAEWKPPEGHLPPFYTIMYPADVFLDPKKHYEYIKNMRSHEDVERLFDCTRMPDGRYCVNTHENNISTSWMGYKHKATKETQHEFIGKQITKDKEKILKNFGV